MSGISHRYGILRHYNYPCFSLSKFSFLIKSSSLLNNLLLFREGKKREKKKKQKVHFAKDVMDPRGDGEDFRRQLIKNFY
ncbi:hypothetical protein QQP08_018185 [Theobroma cacao]|nr:hypothetical protein QQP08_018185 [Theobroma cacao]